MGWFGECSPGERQAYSFPAQVSPAAETVALPIPDGRPQQSFCRWIKSTGWERLPKTRGWTLHSPHVLNLGAQRGSLSGASAGTMRGWHRTPPEQRGWRVLQRDTTGRTDARFPFAQTL